MAVRFDATTENLNGGVSIDYSGAYTLAGWVYPITVGGFVFSIISSSDDQHHYDALKMRDESGIGTAFFLEVAISAGWYLSGFSKMTVGRWHYVAMVRRNATDIAVIVDGYDLVNHVSANVTGRSAANVLRVGAHLGWVNGTQNRQYNLMAWNRALATDDIRQQMTQFVPVSYAGLFGWWPLDVPSFGIDASGRGGRLTAGGTLHNEPNPPFEYERKPYLLGFTTAATPAVDQLAYRWSNDDGSETTATWAAAANTGLTADRSSPARLRVQLNAIGDIPAKIYGLQYRQSGADTWEDVTT